MNHFRSIYFLFIVFLTACSTTFPRGISNEIYKGYSGESLQYDEISIINMGENVEWVQVNEHKILHENYGQIALLPGEYKIKWGTKFAVSTLLKFSGKDIRTWGGIVNLKPANTYTITAIRTTGSGYNVFVKIEEFDGTTIRNITSEIKEGGEYPIN